MDKITTDWPARMPECQVSEWASLEEARSAGYTSNMIAFEEIERVVLRIAEASHAKQVVLFGSHARGQASENSDVDLLIIAESQLPRFKRSRELYKLFQPYPFAMDLIVYTPEEIERSKQSPCSFVSRVLQEGRVVYDHRVAVGSAMAGEGEK
jgi:uncharacterized protein